MSWTSAPFAANASTTNEIHSFLMGIVYHIRSIYAISKNYNFKLSLGQCPHAGAHQDLLTFGIARFADASAGYPHAAAFDRKTACREMSQGLRKRQMLLHLDAGVKRLGSVVLHHRHALLHDYRA